MSQERGKRIPQLEVAVDQSRRRQNLTPRRRRFIKEVAAGAAGVEAAIRAGYSPRSARTTAYRLMRDELIQSELAQHFVDQEREISDTLRLTVLRLRRMVETAKDTGFLRAAKLLLEYVRIAAGILGLEVKAKPQPIEQPSVNLTPEELIEVHREEIRKLEALLLKKHRNPTDEQIN